MLDHERTALIAAYVGTAYLILDRDGAGVAEARIGETSRDIDALLDSHGARSGVFVTGWNPRSEVADGAANDAAHAALQRTLAERGVRFLPHIGIGADPRWTERGLFALDLDPADALALATDFAQNAVVLVCAGEQARLLPTELMAG